MLLNEGVGDVGFFEIDEGPLPYGISIAVPLSQAIIDEIENEPTHTYFNHYRSVNFFIDQMLLKAGLFLERNGYRYITVAASQSINKDGWNYSGRFSHKAGARLAGMGSIGKSALFIHKKYGPAVRLGTVFTDCPFDVSENEIVESPCGECNACAKACPAGAIKGKCFLEGMEREEIFDPAKCSDYMKNKFKNIGRGAVCGLCIKACVKANQKRNNTHSI